MTDGQEPGNDFADRIDDALRAIWHGRSDPLDQLLDDEGSGQLGIGALLSPATVARRTAATESPPTISNYQIVRELGCGAMGRVYEARQLHPPRTVALKVVRAAGDTHAQRIKLFQREIEVLARLKHANIATLHEVGRTDDGRYFFTMELVQGQTLKRFVNAEDVPDGQTSAQLEWRLRLFLQVCDAISYAHQRGVIHRDIKPSNILVTQDDQGGSTRTSGARVKVLDFGLARVVDPNMATASLTKDAGELRGTLAYMSPEQALGRSTDIDVRSDVYALGVVLFELITGEMPYDLRRLSMTEAIRAICETPITRPGEMAGGVSRDLDTIVLKALSRDPQERYQSVSALAEDLVRLLSDQPILARPPSSLYQITKLISRHKLPSAAIGFAVAASVIGFAVSATLYSQTKAARRAEYDQTQLAMSRLARAEAEASKANTVLEFLSSMLASADPAKEGRDVKVIDVLHRALVDVEAGLEDEPEVEASIRHVIGTTFLELDVLQQAESQLRVAADMRADLLGPAHNDTLHTRHNLAMTLHLRAKHQESETLIREVLETSRQVSGNDSAATLRSMDGLAVILHYQGRLDEAEPLLERTVEVYRSSSGEAHEDTLGAMSRLALLYQDQGRYDEAEPLFRHVWESRSAALPEEHPRVLVGAENLAGILDVRGELEEAAAIYSSTLEISERVMGPEHTRTLVLMNDLARILQRQDRHAEAERHFAAVLDIRRRTIGHEHQSTLVSVNNLAALYREMERYAEAETLFREAVSIGTRVLPEDHWYIAIFRANLGRCLVGLKRFKEAETELLRGEAGIVEAMGEDHPRTAMVRSNVAAMYEEWAKPIEAAKWRDLATLPTATSEAP